MWAAAQAIGVVERGQNHLLRVSNGQAAVVSHLPDVLIISGRTDGD
jgi:hypothetical protein